MLKWGYAFAAAGVATLSTTPAHSYESSSAVAMPGLFIGTAAAAPPPGIYGFDRASTLQSNIAGPVTKVIGDNTGLQVGAITHGFVFVPGWTFLGATYDAAIAVPLQMQSVGSPVNVQSSGMYNTYIAPFELSWKLGDSGFFAKVGLGMYVPDGTQTGIAKLSNVGDPYWTFIPQLSLSYLKNGWNLTANLYNEMNTANSVTGYTTGDIFHVDLTATKQIDKWTIGPVAYYVGQVTGDKSSGFYNYKILNANRYDRVAVGALLGYDFGPAQVQVWATEQVYTATSGATSGGPINLSSVPNGFSVAATLRYRVWAPDQETTPSEKRPFFIK
ncbi:transporter [Bradyrhizobium sp. CW9]|uniref:SphA family protein n=1 Tax=Bradyrhizobium sp. CW9 TaxID=2782689 RepID=UPI001FFA7ED7|nr:transporter [Bradyrhizobium sp. CW9]MCK1328841.1 transporter [Bradyrhizobium sp. CW9]